MSSIVVQYRCTVFSTGEQYRPPPPEPPQKKPPTPGERASRPGPRDTEDTEAEYMSRRRTDFMEDCSEESDYVKTYYDSQKTPNGAVGAVYR